MSASPLIRAIQERLSLAGYVDLPTPFKTAGVEFAFTGVMRGHEGRALDLVLLVDTVTGAHGDRDGTSVRRRIEALSRALDVTGSRYVVTAILAGAVLTEGIEALSEICRVLHVEGIPLDVEGNPANDIAEQQLDDRIRVLLPLSLPAQLPEIYQGHGLAMDELARELPADSNKALVDALINASSVGEQAVTEAVAAMINRVLLLGSEEGLP